MNTVLLLTGTINTDDMSKTALTNPLIRKQQYIDAINYWLSATELFIVFVENSSTDISSEFKNISYRDRVEFLNFEGNNYDKSIGKGLGEMNCLIYAINESSLLKKADFIFKITGRLKVINFQSFLNHIHKNPVQIMCDLRTNLSFVDSRFWGCRPEFVNNYLMKYTSHLNDSKGVYFEHVLAKAVLKALSENYSFSFFPYSPKIEGVSGTSNKKYNNNILYWFIKNRFKKIFYFLLNR